MKRKIEITVSGETGVGKTTIAELIKELLVKEGFACAYVNEEPGDLTKQYADSKERRQETAKAMVEVIIEEESNIRRGFMG